MRAQRSCVCLPVQVSVHNPSATKVACSADCPAERQLTRRESATTGGDVMRNEGSRLRAWAARSTLVILIVAGLAGGRALGQERVFVTDGGNGGDTLLIMDTSLTPDITPIQVG